MFVILVQGKHKFLYVLYSSFHFTEMYAFTRNIPHTCLLYCHIPLRRERHISATYSMFRSTSISPRSLLFILYTEETADIAAS